jgi:hypothetical protein
MGVILEKNGYCATQVVQLEFSDVLAVEKDTAFSRVIYTSYELQNRAFP